MKLTFTGTQQGMTEAQRETCRQFLTWPIEAINIGGCVGADDDFFSECVNKGLGHLINLWPSDIKSKWGKALTEGHHLVRSIHAPDAPLERNHSMVNVSDTLLATPSGIEEELRSGTWATIRYARKNHLRVFIVWPDGKLEEEPK